LIRAYKFLLRPTAKQVTALEAYLEDHRQIYNAALEERREAWKKCKVSISYGRQAAQLTAIRKADPDGQGRWSCGSQQQTLRRLDKAFADFFRRVKAGAEKVGYPRFKGSGRFNTIEFPAQKCGARWDSVPHPTVTRVYFVGIGHVRAHQHRAVRGRIKTISIKREVGRWYVILVCDDVPAEPLPATGAIVGIDLGIVSFLTTSDGEHVPNPRPRATAADRLADAQRSLARKKRGSRRRRRAVLKVAGIHQKMRRSRLDHAHKTSLALVRDHDVIVHEDLLIENMKRRPKPRLADDGTYKPNGAAAKAGLNESIHDAGWGVFLRVLAAKAEWAGRTTIAVNAAYTSQTCACCGHCEDKNRKDEKFRCLRCGHEAHADVNAAVNILRSGLVLQAQAA
jgi:putative transposase